MNDSSNENYILTSDLAMGIDLASNLKPVLTQICCVSYNNVNCEEPLTHLENYNFMLDQVFEDRDAGTPDDKMRLFLIYYICSHQLPDSEVDDYANILQVCTKVYSKYHQRPFLDILLMNLAE